MPKTLEVCVDNFESALSAINGGATRIELCSSLIEGGLTPTPGLLIQIQHANTKKIPIFCMIRCRAGDFVYTPEEIEVMKEDTKILRRNGADGIVFGALLENYDVDMKSCRDIITAAFPLPVTFHRAFDFCRRPTIEIEVIIDLGFARVLTSGKQPNAQLGVKLIKKLMSQVDGRIIIMAGGGVTTENIKYIIDNTDCMEFHGSFKKQKEIVMKNSSKASGDDHDEKAENGDVKIDLGEKNGPLYVTDQNLVAKMVQILKSE